MTKSLRHTLLVLAAACMVVACEDNALPSDSLGTDGIEQGKIKYDTIANMRDLIPGPGDTIDVVEAIRRASLLPPGDNNSAESKSGYVYILGYVKSFGKKDIVGSIEAGVTQKDIDKAKTDFEKYGSRFPTLTDKLQSRTIDCYQMKGLKGAGFTDADQLKVGDIIVVKGQLQNFNGTLQVANGQLVTSDNPLSGWKPAPKEIVKESFDASIGTFAIVDKKAASTDVWKHIEPVTGDNPKQGYMCGTALINNVAEEAESWLVSPEMDLTGCTKGALLTFSHYGYFKGTATADERAQLMKLMVSTDGDNWTQLPINHWNANLKEKRFTADTIDLKDHISTKTKIAFAYKSTAEKALTWGVQNVRVGEPEE